MKTIWKYNLEVKDNQQIRVPEGAKPLHVAVQAGQPVLWCEVDPNLPRVPLNIYTSGTGHALPNLPLRYISTYQLLEGKFVGHVFVEINSQIN